VENVGKEIYSAVPPTSQLTVSTRAPDATPVKQYLDTRHHASHPALGRDIASVHASITPQPAPLPQHAAYYNYAQTMSGYFYTPFYK